MKKLLINIPDIYQNRIKTSEDQDELWLEKITQFIRNAQSIITESPFFFPEYTKHTVEHINNVLDISVNLIPDKTLQKLNADAIAVLIMGIVSHDIGMFVKPDGLHYLLTQMSWQKNWKIYQNQIKHYSSTEIEKFFGNPKNFSIDDKLDIMQLPNEISYKTLNPWRTRLCGEFLRQLHPQLAQEIIDNGFPGTEQIDLFSNIEIDSRYRKLVGIIARSHGVNIDGLDAQLKLIDEERPEYPYGIPIYYLMAILRMADYFDAGEDRAPHAIIKMQHLESEVSYDEFKWNQVVKLGNDWGKKTYERVYVEIETENIDSRTFLKIEDWLKRLQYELDICWRQISINYSDEYQFTIRRIHSNIFQESTRKVIESRIVIDKAQLQASSEILEHLISPLYGGDVTYGVRELLQNALDACREKKAIEIERGNKKFEGEIWVEINSIDKKPYFSITDNGCGMTKDVILKYFLVAGSSYRDNVKWKEQFENQKIKRSGKFGIGVLASFLLGNRITVETKPVDEDTAYFFEVNKQNYDQINISRNIKIKNNHIAKNKSGTSIHIEIGQEIADKMVKKFNKGEAVYCGTVADWMQWYWLPLPMVKYIVNNKEYKNPYANKNSKQLYGLEKNGRWFHLKTKGEFDDIWWTHEANDKIWCNGIYITDENILGGYADYLTYKNDYVQDFNIKMPSIAVMDSRNAMDLNLSRDKIQSFPEIIQQSLFIENCKLALSLLMMLDFSQQNEFYIEFPFCIRQNSGNLDHLLYSSKGYNLPIRYVFKKIEAEKIWVLYKDGRWKNFPFEKLTGIVSLLHYGDHIDYGDEFRDGLFHAFYMGEGQGLRFDAVQIKMNYINDFCDVSPSVKINGIRTFSERIEDIADMVHEEEFYIRDNDIEEIFNLDMEKYFPYVKKIQDSSEDFIIAARKKSDINDPMMKDLKGYFEVACEYKVLAEDLSTNAAIDKLLDKYLEKEIWIPYDIKERKKMFPKFFDPNDDIYKYVELVGKNNGFYNVKEINNMDV